MPAVNVNLADVVESKPVPPGRYGLTVAAAEYNEEKNQFIVEIGIDEHEDSPNIRHYISLPNEDDEPRKAAYKALLLKRFLVAFNVVYSDDEVDCDNFPGCQADLEVTLSEPNDKGRIYNNIVLPFLPDEQKKPAAKAAASKAPPKRGR